MLAERRASDLKITSRQLHSNSIHRALIHTLHNSYSTSQVAVKTYMSRIPKIGHVPRRRYGDFAKPSL